jgi:hypothetical protein
VAQTQDRKLDILQRERGRMVEEGLEEGHGSGRRSSSNVSRANCKHGFILK